MMIPRVITVQYKYDFVVHVRFADGIEGDIDLGDELHGEIFEPLKDLALFKKVFVHPEFQTLCWPNGADLSPEFLYEKIQIPV